MAFLLLLLPALALARVDVQLSGKIQDADAADMHVYYSGSDVGIITDDERSKFQLSDDRLKRAVESYFGKRPDDAYLKSPTPWGDLYWTYGWNEVQRTFIPKNAKVLKVYSRPELVLQQIFENNSSRPATFNVGVSQSVDNTISSSWTRTEQLSLGQEISYSVTVDFLKGGGSTSMSFSSSYGYGAQHTETVTIGSSSAMQMLLQPGQSVVSKLYSTRGFIQFEVDYEASLSGHVAVNYSKKYKDHHFWALNVNNVMSAGGLSNAIRAKEIVDIGLYSNARIEVFDRSSNKKIFGLDV